MANIIKTQVKPAGVRIILVALAVLILFNLMARTGLIDLTPFQADVITIFGSLFLLSEVAFVQMIRRKNRKSFNIVDTLITVVALLAILGVVLSWTKVTIAFLDPYQGLVELGLLIFVGVEIFRTN